MAQRWPSERLDPASYVAPGIDLPIFYGDLDTNRHLNNVAFGRFFEHARYTAHIALGIADILHDTGGSTLVAHVAIDYLAEGQLGSPLHVRTRVASIGRTSMVEEQAAWQNDTCLALAEIVVVYREFGASANWPDKLRAALQLMQRPAPPGHVE